MPEISANKEQRKSSRPIRPRKYRLVFGLSRRAQKIVMTLVVMLVVITFGIGTAAIFFFGTVLGLDTDGTNTSTGEVTGGKNIGTLVGQPLTDFQINHAMIMARIHLLLAMGATEDPIDQFNKAVRKTAWRWLASLRYAAKLGITASKEEAAQAELDQFKKDGVFLAEEYEYFIKKRLPDKHIAVADFRAYMRNAMVLSRLENAMATTAWIPPFDMKREISRFTDTFKIESVDIPMSSLDAPVAVTADEARTFYESNPRYFIQPDRMRVSYTMFPVSNFTAAAATLAEARAREHFDSYKSDFETVSNGIKTVRTFAEVKEQLISNIITDMATNYYIEHMSEYTTTDTNYMSVTKPFSEVKDAIVDSLAMKDARGAAEEKAIEFVDTMNPGKIAKLVAMERAAAATNLIVYTSAYFGRYESVPGLDVSSAFNRHAFENLRAGDPYDHFSAPIVEQNAIYVLSYLDKVDSHLSDFEAASNTAYELARIDKKSKALAAKASDIHKALLAGLKASKSFQDAARELKLTPVAGGPFSYLSQPNNIPISALASCNDRELTDPVISTNGATIAYIVSREDGTMSTDPSFLQQLAESIRKGKSDRMFIDWQQKLVAKEQAVIDDKDSDDDADVTNTLKNVKAPAKGKSAGTKSSPR